MAVPGLDPGIGPGHPDPVKRCAFSNRDHRHKAGDDDEGGFAASQGEFAANSFVQMKRKSL
jgi:hypothetical protein